MGSPKVSVPTLMTLILNINVNWGENDPAKKPPPVKPKKAYNKIVNWWEGCPYCDAIPKSYDSYRQHVSY